MEYITKERAMDKKTILTELRAQIGNQNINFPRDIQFNIEGNNLHVQIILAPTANVRGGSDAHNPVLQNLQNNSAAFESWIICIKASFKELEDVYLDWRSPDNPDSHDYRRFLFRIMMFKLMYTWFKIPKSKNWEVQQVEKTLAGGDIICNYPLKPIDRLGERFSAEQKLRSASDWSEAYVKWLFVQNDSVLNKYLKQKVKLDTDVYSQLPTGVFDGEIHKSKALFSIGASGIDLWGIEKDTLKIFELRYKKVTIGILSQLFFYLSICRELFLAKGRLQYPNKLIEKDIQNRGFNHLYYQQHKMKKIEGYLLADQFHPLLTNEVIDLFNEGLAQLGNIKVKKLNYTDH